MLRLLQSLSSLMSAMAALLIIVGLAACADPAQAGPLLGGCKNVCNACSDNECEDCGEEGGGCTGAQCEAGCYCCYTNPVGCVCCLNGSDACEQQ
jgi:hypothetical protein